jgi:hypothetical protein
VNDFERIAFTIHKQLSSQEDLSKICSTFIIKFRIIINKYNGGYIIRNTEDERRMYNFAFLTFDLFFMDF